ncbi:phage integrase family protein [Synechococcus sp. BIOS-U3-1]|nr:phage integrase family protein [Synechococcus sp. BIOS-U3-1]
MKGLYYVEVYDGPRRRSLSLKTDSYELACQRYKEGLRELLNKIRREHQATRKTPAWLPEQLDDLRQEYQQNHELDAQELAASFTGKRGYKETTGELKDAKTEELAELIAGVNAITWEELRVRAEAVRKHKTGSGYSISWHKNIDQILQRVPFTPEQATVRSIRAWMDQQASKGVTSVTLKNWCSALQGLIERAITSGHAPQLAPNVFKQIDFSISKELELKNVYYCPTKEDYRKLFNEVLPELPENYRVGIELMVWTGCRVSGTKHLATSTEPGWLDVPDEDGTKGGGRVPVPMELWIRGRDLKVISGSRLSAALKKVHPKLSNHGLRSGFKRATRAAGIDSVLGEALMMHKLQELEATYGGEGFPDEALKAGSEKTWEAIRGYINS